MKRITLMGMMLVLGFVALAQEDVYRKRILETTEIDVITSLYAQDGSHAAVTGGNGTEELYDAAGATVISIPLNEDDILTIDASVSAYSSASSSNVNPFDGRQEANPFVASTGASKQDIWSSFQVAYTSNSVDRNKIWSAKMSFSNEYDYTSVGLGGHWARLYNRKNTELGFSANLFIDQWKLIYPIELRTPSLGDDDEDELLNWSNVTLSGNPNYAPVFTPMSNAGRYSMSVGFSLSQVLHRRVQASWTVDLIQQAGLLSTPFQRVYFSDIDDSFLESFHLAEGIELLPNERTKLASGVRVNAYLSEYLVIRSFYRYYQDDWDIRSHTVQVQLPIKLNNHFSINPNYRYYSQTQAEWFAPYNQHSSASSFYTSDFDLSDYQANQFGLGMSYTDIFAQKKFWALSLKSIDFNYYFYQRNIDFDAHLISLSAKFVVNHDALIPSTLKGYLPKF